jgi:hypothetical protein
MDPTLRAVVRSGKIELLEPRNLPEGMQLLIVCPTESDSEFWQAASQSSIDKIWDNPEDDVYAALLEE